MLYFLIIIGLLGLVVGILMSVAPSILQKVNVVLSVYPLNRGKSYEWANATLISTDKALIRYRLLTGIILSLLSLYILRSAYIILK
jgi:hypothetical protein